MNFSRYAVPQPLLVDIVDTMARYGRLQLVKHPAHGLTLVSLDRAVLEEVLRNKKIAPMLGARIDDDIANASVSNPKAIEGLTRARAKTQSDLDAAEQAWVSAEEALAEVS